MSTFGLPPNSSASNSVTSSQLKLSHTAGISSFCGKPIGGNSHTGCSNDSSGLITEGILSSNLHQTPLNAPPLPSPARVVSISTGKKSGTNRTFEVSSAASSPRGQRTGCGELSGSSLTSTVALNPSVVEPPAISRKAERTDEQHESDTVASSSESTSVTWLHSCSDVITGTCDVMRDVSRETNDSDVILNNCNNLSYDSQCLLNTPGEPTNLGEPNDLGEPNNLSEPKKHSEPNNPRAPNNPTAQSNSSAPNNLSELNNTTSTPVRKARLTRVKNSLYEECNNTQTDSTAKTDDVTRHCAVVKRESSVDIDGLPLSDQRKRVDLRRLLSQDSTEEWEEDEAMLTYIREAESSRVMDQSQEESMEPQQTFEESFNFDDFEFPDDDEDEERVTRRLRRKSSLRSVRSDEGATSLEGGSSQGVRKIVKFADSLGLSLSEVKALLNPEEPPCIPSSALRDLNMRRRRATREGPTTEGLVTLEMDFEMPSSRPDFVKRLLDQKIVLENCVSSERTVCGVVRVANVSFSKRVFVRYTMNSWVTEHDVLALFVPDSSDGVSDRFVFSLALPERFGVVESQQAVRARVEFALCYCAGEATYWDNNNGDNYVISGCLLDPCQ